MRQVIEAIVRVEKTAINVARRLVVVILMVLNIHGHVAHDAMRDACRSSHGVITRAILVSGFLRADMMGGYYTILLLLRLGRLVVVCGIVRSHALVRQSIGRVHCW